MKIPAQTATSVHHFLSIVSVYLLSVPSCIVPATARSTGGRSLDVARHASSWLYKSSCPNGQLFHVGAPGFWHQVRVVIQVEASHNLKLHVEIGDARQRSKDGGEENGTKDDQGDGDQVSAVALDGGDGRQAGGEPGGDRAPDRGHRGEGDEGDQELGRGEGAEQRGVDRDVVRAVDDGDGGNPDKAADGGRGGVLVRAAEGHGELPRSKRQGERAEQPGPPGGDDEQPGGGRGSGGGQDGDAGGLPGGNLPGTGPAVVTRGGEQEGEHDQVIDVGDGEDRDRDRDGGEQALHALRDRKSVV